MKSTLVICGLAVSLSIASTSFAQGYDRENNQQGYSQRDQDSRDGDRLGYQRKDHDRRGQPEAMGNRGSEDRAEQYYYGARGPEWRRGGRIPPEYRNRQYVVDDWRAHHLARPPRGYQWVQVGSDYVLVAIATGIIAQLLQGQ